MLAIRRIKCCCIYLCIMTKHLYTVTVLQCWWLIPEFSWVRTFACSISKQDQHKLRTQYVRLLLTISSSRLLFLALILASSSSVSIMPLFHNPEPSRTWQENARYIHSIYGISCTLFCYPVYCENPWNENKIQTRILMRCEWQHNSLWMTAKTLTYETHNRFMQHFIYKLP